MKTNPSSLGKFTVFCLGLVILYQGANLALHRSLGFYLRADHSSVSLRIDGGNRVLARIPLISELVFHSPQRFDESSKLIAGVGYAVRYVLSDLPQFIFQRPFKKSSQLFLSDEARINQPELVPAIAQKMGASLKELQKRCEALDLRLIVMVVPTKLSVIFPSPSSQQTYDALEKELPGEKLDLFHLFSSYRAEHPDDDLYLPYDNHWSSLGIALTAKALLGKLGASPQARLLTQNAYNPNRQSFFTDALQLPLFFRDHYSPFSWRERLYGVESSVPPDSHSAPNVYLAGTSFTQRLSDSRFGMKSLLQSNLPNQVIDLSVEAAGKYASLRALFDRKDLKKGIVVWEFPLHQALDDDKLESSNVL